MSIITEHDEQMPCVECADREVCEGRQPTEQWIYSDQFTLCLDIGHPEYHDIEWWLEKEDVFVHGGTSGDSV